MSNPEVSRFRGLNNVSDPLRLGLEWLVQADNINVTDTGALEPRAGFSKSLGGAFTGAFSTFDYSRMYVVDGGSLKAMADNTTAVTLKTGLSAVPMHFTEINEQVYFNNGQDCGVITPDNEVLPWTWPEPDMPGVAAVTGSLPAGQYQVVCTFALPDGRETGTDDAAQIALTAGQALQISNIPKQPGCSTNVYIAPADSQVFQWAGAPSGTAMVWDASPDNLGVELFNHFLNPLPPGCDVIQAWGGRIYAAQYFPELGQSVVWASQPMGFHLFDLDKDFILVPGHVLMLAPHDGGLIVGTDKAIYSYEAEDRLKQLAPYGVVPGWHWSKDDPNAEDSDKRVIFWTTRGVCAALPFSNLTEKAVSVAPGASAGGAIVRQGGQKRYLVALQQGGSAFNQQ